jgi:4-amino-4-deoxy-L-arabinose transferase-like glycosyltransferase
MVQLLAAGPLAILGKTSDWSEVTNEKNQRPRPEFATGHRFERANQANFMSLVRIARLACLPITLLGAIICFAWSYELNGRRAAILSLSLWCFSPSILAHASLITSDVGATSFGLMAAYSFWRWLRSQCWATTLFAGTSLGLAMSARTVWLILCVLWPLAWLWHLSRCWERNGHAILWRQAGALATILAIGIYVVNAMYAFDRVFQRLDSFHFVSDALSDNIEPSSDGHGEDRRNRFENSVLGCVPIPFPADFLLGLDLQKKDFEHFGSPSYLAGVSRSTGWWHYYIVGLIAKTPVGTLLLIAWSWALTLRNNASFLRAPRVAALVLPPISILVLSALNHGMTQHVRYIICTLPFAFVIAGEVVSRTYCVGRLRRGVVLCLTLASVMSTLSVFPHCLSYFNEAAGGPRNGHSLLLGSNSDWGQDLLFLRDWFGRQSDSRVLNLSYSGEVDPRNLGISFELPLSCAASAAESVPPRGAWIAISTNFLHGYSALAPDGHGGVRRIGADWIECYTLRDPVAWAGYTIAIFDEANAVERRQVAKRSTALGGDK